MQRERRRPMAAEPDPGTLIDLASVPDIRGIELEPMDAGVARGLAYAAHGGARDRSGELLIEHVARVAAAVPGEAQATAWLHDVLEKTPTTLDELSRQGIRPIDGEALALLTRAPDEN